MLLPPEFDKPLRLVTVIFLAGVTIYHVTAEDWLTALYSALLLLAAAVMIYWENKK